MLQFFDAFGVDVFKLAFQVVNFLLLLWLLNRYLFKPVMRMLDERSDRIRRGLEDAEQARRDRERSEAERAEALQAARREANDIIGRAQKAAQELRDTDLRATREELERLRERAASEIEAEKQRAIADLRAEVADLALAAAGKVVGESMTGERERRLVQQFLAETAPAGNGTGRGAAADGGSAR
ncbi:MAG TPA: F0F1 ATP synthase subunit B [Candidatus Limnocylindrales bacterium]